MIAVALLPVVRVTVALLVLALILVVANTPPGHAVIAAARARLRAPRWYADWARSRRVRRYKQALARERASDAARGAAR